MNQNLYEDVNDTEPDVTWIRTEDYVAAKQGTYSGLAEDGIARMYENFTVTTKAKMLLYA